MTSSFSHLFKLEAIPTQKLLSNPIALSSAVTLSYLAFYTGYDKEKKRLQPSNLLDLFFFRRGLDWSLVEWNKAISLSGLTTVLLAYLPQLKEQKRDLLFISMSMLWTHSVYSYYKFWQFSVKKLLADKWMKRLSVALGGLGQVALVMSYLEYYDPKVLMLSTIGLSLAHFVTMEVDYKYRLQVRPYAYLPFPLAAYTLYEYFFGPSH
jgi:hypothetical protein